MDGWLPDDAILCFEGGRPDAEIESFMQQAVIPERVHIAPGTLWPRPRTLHVPAAGNLARLADIMERHAFPELAVHLRAYGSDALILQWYDASADPLRVNGAISEDKVRTLAHSLGTTFRRESR